ncbi:MAG: PAS domain S-box protein [Anaerolineae bacterium]|nr:PAS domain S-box protein [Anaerolineae bacterium]
MPNIQILVVEDDLIVARSIQNHLQSLGYNVPTMVTTGKEALAKVGQAQPDLVLMDIKLPGQMDGVAAAEQIRAHYNIPVVYLTAYADDETLARAKITGPFGYILKPFGVKELHSTIELALYKHQVEQKLDRLNRVLRAIRNVNQLITHEKDRNKLLRQTCECLIETRGYHRAWIACLNDSGQVVTAAQAGFKEEVFHAFLEQLAQNECSPCLQKVMAGPGVLSIEDSLAACPNCVLQEQQPGEGKLVVRLAHQAKIYGLMAVSIPAELAADEEEHALFQEVAGDIAFALYSLEAEEKRNRIAEALRQSESRYKRLLESVTDYIYTVKFEQGRPVSTTHGPGCKAVTGYTPEEYEADPYLWYRMIHADDREAVTEQANRLAAGETAASLEHRIAHKDGSIRWVSNTPVPRYDETGQLVAYDGLIADITTRKQAETEAQQSRDQLQSIFSVAPIGIGVVVNRTFTFINDRLIEMLGYSREELLGQNARMIYPSDEEYEGVGREKYGQIREKGWGSVETKMQCKNGPIIDVLLSSCPIDPQNLSRGVTFTILDITARKRTEAALRRERDKAQQYLDIAGVMLVALNEKGQITLLNRRGHRILGYKEGELLGQNWFDTCLPPAVRERVKEVFNLMLAGEIELGERHENPVLTKSGEERIIAWRNINLTNSEGHIVGTLSSGEDITERKQAEQEREELQAQLLQAKKMEAIGRLTGGIAHDFNNLLTAINGFAELAQHRLTPDDPLQEMLGYIFDSGQRAAGLIRQLLAFSSKQIIAPQIIDLNLLVTDLQKMLQRIIREDILMETVLAPDLGLIKADPAQMEQIIVNLVVNARDAMPGGGKLTIKTANTVLNAGGPAEHPELTAGRYIMLTVSDTGIGMSREVQAQIFEPFFTTKKQGQGTGLGLSTVYGIVRQNGGDININSEEGRGTTFKVYLPQTGETGPALGVSEHAGAIPTGDETILVVEDDAGVRDLIRQVLAGQGYKILETQNGQEALQLIADYADPIHLLLTDVVMPDMNGKTLAKSLAHSHPHLKIILISGYGDETITTQDLDRGIAFLKKPFNSTTLARQVRLTLDTPTQTK